MNPTYLTGPLASTYPTPCQHTGLYHLYSYRLTRDEKTNMFNDAKLAGILKDA